MTRTPETRREELRREVIQAKSEQGTPKAKGTVKREPNPENQAAQDAYLLKTPHFNKYPQKSRKNHPKRAT